MTNPDLLQFFKALADEQRLKIVGLLARESHSVEALAAMLGLKPATVSHHLSKLAEAGLVSARMEGHSKLFTLRLDRIHSLANALLARDTLPEAAASVDTSAYDRKVLSDFLQPDGRLKEIPAQQKKLQAVLRQLVKDFEPGRPYPEKAVNEILGRYHDDVASLRRSMISYRLMKRERGIYTRVAANGGS